MHRPTQAFLELQGSVEKASQVVPKSKGVGGNRSDRGPASGPPHPARSANGSSHYAAKPSAYYPNSAATPGQQGYASGQIPVQGLGQGPTDPRRALAANAAVPGAAQSGQIPTRFGAGNAPAAAAGQYGKLIASSRNSSFEAVLFAAKLLPE